MYIVHFVKDKFFVLTIKKNFFNSCVCPVVEEASHWQRHSDHHLPGVQLRSVLSAHHSLALPAHLHRGSGGEPKHHFHQVQVSAVGKGGKQT